MITVKFRKQADRLCGVMVSGHAGYADAGEDIVCAAVTSAVGLCECAITDVVVANARVSVNEQSAQIKIDLPKQMDETKRKMCEVMLEALRLHLTAMASDYPQCIRVSEV